MKLLFILTILSSFTLFLIHSDEKTGSCVTMTGSENQLAGQIAFIHNGTQESDPGIPPLCLLHN
jgi:hypothetical protein